MANVFISHREIDSGEALRLASDLRGKGHNVWLDKDAIALGDSIVERINEGLVGASYLVLCYSAAGVSSPWMSREWMSTLARQMSSANIKIMPVRLTGADAPAILADIQYADLTKDWNSGLARLLSALV